MSTATPTATTARLWTNDNGAIYCDQHGGGYLDASIAAKPRATRHRTPRGTWNKVDAAVVQEMAQAGFPTVCETCGVAAQV